MTDKVSFAVPEFLKSIAANQMAQIEHMAGANHKMIDFLSRANQVALRGANNIAKRHAAILQETADEFSQLARNAAGEMSASTIVEARQHCIDLAADRTLEHLRTALDWSREMNEASYSLMEKNIPDLLDLNNGAGGAAKSAKNTSPSK